jgi:hypothetical protein
MREYCSYSIPASSFATYNAVIVTAQTKSYELVMLSRGFTLKDPDADILKESYQEGFEFTGSPSDIYE